MQDCLLILLIVQNYSIHCYDVDLCSVLVTLFLSSRMLFFMQFSLVLCFQFISAMFLQKTNKEHVIWCWLIILIKVALAGLFQLIIWRSESLQQREPP
jgi:D-alanyl-lipoteichoic acid acyltransferase DltB (MBOAT superfamily)